MYKDKEKLREYQRNYNKRVKRDRREYSKKRYQELKTKFSEYHKNWIRNHPNYYKSYRKKHPELKRRERLLARVRRANFTEEKKSRIRRYVKEWRIKYPEKWKRRFIMCPYFKFRTRSSKCYRRWKKNNCPQSRVYECEMPKIVIKPQVIWPKLPYKGYKILNGEIRVKPAASGGYNIRIIKCGPVGFVFYQLFGKNVSDILLDFPIIAEPKQTYRTATVETFNEKPDVELIQKTIENLKKWLYQETESSEYSSDHIGPSGTLS